MHLFIDKFSPATFGVPMWSQESEQSCTVRGIDFASFYDFSVLFSRCIFLFFTLLHLCEPSYEELFLIKMHIVSIIFMADYFIFYFKWNV
jgi:hypothetical protein